jgi:hypothetical protein
MAPFDADQSVPARHARTHCQFPIPITPARPALWIGFGRQLKPCIVRNAGHLDRVPHRNMARKGNTIAFATYAFE